MTKIKFDSSPKSALNNSQQINYIVNVSPSFAYQDLTLLPISLNQRVSKAYNSVKPIINQPQSSYSLAVFAGSPQEDFDWINTKNAFQRIIHLRDLEDNWDGYGASKFSASHIHRVLEIYSIIFDYFSNKNFSLEQVNLFVAPSSDGSVLLEFSGELYQSKELEIYIPSSWQKPLVFLKIDESSDVEEENEILDSQVTELLEWLISNV